MINNFEQFKIECEKALMKKFACPRHVATHKNCISESRQKNCFSKYKRKNERTKKRITEKRIDDRSLYKDFAAKVWLRDTGLTPNFKDKNWWHRDNWADYCRFYNCLTSSERIEYLASISVGESMFKKSLVIAHRISKGSNRALKYDPDDCYLISQVAHDRIDHGYNPLTGKQIKDRMEKDYWWKRIAGEL